MAKPAEHILFYKTAIMEYRAGDESAYTSIWDYAETLIRRQIGSTLPALNWGTPLAEELMQNSRVAVWKAVTTWNEKRNPNFLTYMMTVVRNRIGDTLGFEFRYMERNARYGDEVEEYVDSGLPTLDSYTPDLDLSAGAWSWVSEADSDTLVNGAVEILEQGLSGWLLEVLQLKLAGLTDGAVRLKMRWTPAGAVENMKQYHNVASGLLRAEGYAV